MTGGTTPLFDERGQPFDEGRYRAGMRGSTLAARKWTEEQAAAVDVAILEVARRHETFTADDVWEALPADFPVTKGLAGRLNAAVHRGLIVSTGAVRFAQRGGEHDHRQRLAVWRSLIRGAR